MCIRVVQLWECNCVANTRVNSCKDRCGTILREEIIRLYSPCDAHSTPRPRY